MIKKMQRLADSFFMMRVETSTAIANLKEFKRAWEAAHDRP